MKANGLTVVQGVGKSKIRLRTQSPHIDSGTTEDCGVIFLRISLNNLKHPSQGHFPTTPPLSPASKHTPGADPAGDFVYWAQPGPRKGILTAAGLLLPCRGKACFPEFVCQIHVSSNGPSHGEVRSASPTTSSLL